jgi:hypothetical protein
MKKITMKNLDCQHLRDLGFQCSWTQKKLILKCHLPVYTYPCSMSTSLEPKRPDGFYSYVRFEVFMAVNMKNGIF